MRRFLTFAALLVAAMAASPADAAIRYVFVAFSSPSTGDGTLSGKFTYDSPTFITSGLVVPAADLVSCSATFSVGGAGKCLSATFNLSSAHDTVGFGVSPPGGGSDAVNYAFAANAFAAVGVYFTDGAPGFPAELMVSMVAAPEPATWILTLLGFAGLAAGAHRLRRKTAIGAIGVRA